MRQVLVFLVGPLTWLIIAAAVVLVLRARRGKPGATPPAGVLFHEGFVSGTSHKNVFTRYFVVSRNTASVTVTPSELIIASAIPIGDLNHRAPRATATASVGRTAFGRTAVTVDFDAEGGGRCVVELALRDPDGFVSALSGGRSPAAG